MQTLGKQRPGGCFPVRVLGDAAVVTFHIYFCPYNYIFYWYINTMRPSYTQLQQKVENYGNYDRFPLGFRYPFAANTRDVVSVSRQSRVLTTSRLGLGLFHLVGQDVLCGVRAVWRSIVVVVPYRPICLSP